MPIPEFRSDGYLPVGIHSATQAEVTFRFGSSGRRRRRLILRLRQWIDLGRAVNAPRILVDGSFVTSKSEPNDIDTVMLLPGNFQELVDAHDAAALELDQMFLSRRPEEIFGAENEKEWTAWCDFFSRTRVPGKRKGLVEIEL